MKNKILLLIILFIINQALYAQKKFFVKNVEELKEISSGYRPYFVGTEGNIIFTSATNKGLYLYEGTKNHVKILNADNGSGFQFCLAEDEKTIVYKSYVFDVYGKRQSAIYEQNINTGNKKAIIKNARGLSTISYKNGSLLYLQKSVLKMYILKSQKSKSTDPVAVFTDDDLNLILLNKNKNTIMNPLGKGNYIWASLSPDGQLVLFNKTGNGTYVCDLNGKITADLGRLHAAKWSDDGKWIVGMNDFDDGQRYTSSQIVIVSVDGKNRQSLELKDHKIALFPDISADYSKIVFNDEKGKVFIISLENLIK